MNSVPVKGTLNSLPSQQAKTEILSAVVGIILGIILLAVILIILNYFSILNIPSLSFLPHRSNNNISKIQYLPISNDSLINNCIFAKAKNPLLLEVNNVNNVISGTFRGTIKNIEYDSSQKPSKLLLTSPNQKQSLWFNISKARNNIYSTIVLRPISQSKMGIGNQADINFICDKNSLIQLTQIGINIK